MASRKKAKPSFEVPEELRSAPQTGWVYRSEEQAAPEKPAKPVSVSEPKPAANPPGKAKPRDSEPGILDLVARTLSSGLATIGGIWLLSARLMAAPLKFFRRGV